MSQNEKLIRHMKRRWITTIDAFSRYGVCRLSERCREIERKHPIERKRVKRNGKTWTAYRLAA